jgi:hypothetical protein
MCNKSEIFLRDDRNEREVYVTNGDAVRTTYFLLETATNTGSLNLTNSSSNFSSHQRALVSCALLRGLWSLRVRTGSKGSWVLTLY